MKFAFTCPSCNKRYPIIIYNADFADLYEMRCSKCARTLLLNMAQNCFSRVFTQCGQIFNEHFDTLLAQAIKKCICGGEFSAYAPYRCPICNETVSMDEIKRQIRWWGSKEGMPGVIMWQRMKAGGIWKKKRSKTGNPKAPSEGVTHER